MSKGSKPRNLGPKFFANYDGVNWRRKEGQPKLYDGTHQSWKEIISYGNAHPNVTFKEPRWVDKIPLK